MLRKASCEFQLHIITKRLERKERKTRGRRKDKTTHESRSSENFKSTQMRSIWIINALIRVYLLKSSPGQRHNLGFAVSLYNETNKNTSQKPAAESAAASNLCPVLFLHSDSVFEMVGAEVKGDAQWDGCCVFFLIAFVTLFSFTSATPSGYLISFSFSLCNAVYILYDLKMERNWFLLSCVCNLMEGNFFNWPRGCKQVMCPHIWSQITIVNER